MGWVLLGLSVLVLGGTHDIVHHDLFVLVVRILKKDSITFCTSVGVVKVVAISVGEVVASDVTWVEYCSLNRSRPGLGQGTIEHSFRFYVHF